MNGFHTDTPITGEPGSEDQLNRVEFAERVGKALLLPTESAALVVALEAKWGYGKTSTVNLMIRSLERLEEQDRPIVVSFNPWMIGSAERLVQEFLAQLASNIGVTDNAQHAQDAVKKLLAYSKLFSVVLRLIPGAEIPATILENVTTSVADATSDGADKAPTIDEQRVEVVAALKELDRPIVVLIDDIDRLPPAEVFQVVRLVKAIADFPRVAFLLAFDPAYVEEALSAHGITDARAYLDKLVQVRVHLPRISVSDIHRLVTTEIDKLADVDLTAHFPGDIDRLKELYHLSCKPLMRSVRDVKRVFNRLRFSEKATRGEVCFSDLLALEVVAIKAPKVYELLQAHPEAFTGISSGLGMVLEKPEEYVARYKDDRETSIASVAIEDRQFVRELIEKLFPLVTDSDWDHSNQDYCRTHGQVAATDRLMIALSFGLPSEEVSAQDVNHFIVFPDARDELADAHFINQKLARFVELLRDGIEKRRPPDGVGFLLKLANLAENPRLGDLDQQQNNVLSVGIVRQIGWVATDFMEKTSDEETTLWLQQLFSADATLTLATECLVFCLTQHGEYGHRSTSESDRLCGRETLECIKDLWLDKIRESFESRSILKGNGKGQAFLLLMHLDRQLTSELVVPFLKEDDDLDGIVKVFGVTGGDSVKGKFARVSGEILELFGGADIVRARVHARLEKGVEDQELEAIYSSILSGQKRYLIDASEGDPD